MKIRSTLSFFFIFLFLTFYGQKKDSTEINFNSDTEKKCVEQKEALDIIKKAFKLKKANPADSLNKRKKVLLVILPGFGYTLQTGITIVASFNISFYTIDEKNNNNLSIINSDLEYSPGYHQLIIPILFSVWNNGNKINWTGDCRYIKFNSYTYGLGGNNSLSDAVKTNYSYLKIYLLPYRSISYNLYAGIGYNLDYHWNIASNGDSTDYQLYSNSVTSSVSSGVSINLKYDTRRNSNNPQGGIYCALSLRENFKFLGSTTTWKLVSLDFRKYLKLSNNPYQLLALWSYNAVAFSGKAPYFDLPSTGADSYALTGRGYIPGRFKGNKFLYLETEYRFGITRNGLLGGVLFLNAQGVSDWPSNNFSTINPGAGAGLRIKVNKKSNVNYSVDYGLGLKGSKGFFIHLCEVF